MLNYLAASTRPDCLYAVHQCVRFSSDPRLSHERAVKRIVRYLKGTKDQGIILTPNKKREFNVMLMLILQEDIALQLVRIRYLFLVGLDLLYIIMVVL